jgi:hypothetical protein
MESKERMALTKQIMDLDRQLGQMIAQTAGRTKRLDVHSAAFPIGYWATAAVLLGWWLFGGMIQEGIHGQTALWTAGAGLIIALLAAWKTVRHILWKVSHSKGGHEAGETPEIRALRAKRDELKARLNNLKD